MQATIISIGNSKGIRIPKVLLEESGIKDRVEMVAKKGELRLKPLQKKHQSTTLLSEQSLAIDWDNPEEDRAWENL